MFPVLTVSQIFAPFHVVLLYEPSGCIKFSCSRLDVGNRMIKMSCVFVVVVLQNFINKQWIGAPPADKTDIRQFLNEYLLSHHKTLPTYIRNKLVKVIVDIGRVDWPHFYPNFFSNIIEVLIILCSGASTFYSILALGKWTRIKISHCGHYCFSLDSTRVQDSHEFTVTFIWYFSSSEKFRPRQNLDTDCCNTSGVLYHLSYLATWDLVIFMITC